MAPQFVHRSVGYASKIGMILSLALIANLAYAAPSADPKTKAKAHYLAGRAFFDAGDHARAITEYEAAYEIAPHPEMLFNLAQVHRAAGHNRKALEYYLQYLKESPDGRVADRARDGVDQVTAIIAQEKEAADRDEAARRAAAAPPPKPVEWQPPRSRWVALGVGVGGLALAITGGALLGVVAHDYKQHPCANTSTCSPAEEKQVVDLRPKAYAGYALTAIGGAAAVGGFIAFIVLTKVHPRVAVLPMANGFSVAGAF